MRDAVKNWLTQLPRVQGLLACGVRFPDQTALGASYEKDFPVVALEHAWRSVADTYRVLTIHRLPATRLRWVYRRAVLHSVRREDELVINLLVARDPTDVDGTGVERLIAEFQGLAAGG
jgi:hypothetical protein